MPGKLDDLVAKVSGSQPDRVSAQGKPSDVSADLVSQILNNMNQQEKLLKSREGIAEGVNSTRDNLKSIPGLAGILSSAVAAATGNPDIANGLLSGTISGAQDRNSADTAAAQDQLASVDNAMAAAQNTLSADRQRFSTMINTNPNFLVDPETGESTVDPRLIGYLSTGMLVPIDPGANYAIKKNAKDREAKIGVASDLMKNGDTEAARRRGAVMMNNLLQLKMTPEELTSVSAGSDDDIFNSLLSNGQIDPISVLRARNYQLSEPGKNLTDPSVISMIMPKKTDGTFNLAKHKQDLLSEFTQKISDASDPEIKNQPLDVQIAFAFSGNAGKLAEMRKDFLGKDAFGTGISDQALFSAALSGSAMLSTMFDINPNLSMFRERGIKSKDDIYKSVVSDLNSATSNIRELQANDAGKLVSSAITSVTTAYSSQIDGATAADLALVDVMKARREATSSTGVFDPDVFSAAIKKLKEDAKEGN